MSDREVRVRAGVIVPGGSSVFRGGVTGRLLFGLVLLALGVLWTLDNLGYLDASRYTAWWPAAVVLWGVLRITGLDGCRRPLSGVIGVLVGTALLLSNLGLITRSVWEFWPLLLVVLGAGVVLRSLRAGRPVEVTAADGARLNVFSFLSGHQVRSESPALAGGEVTAILGGGEIDLRQARGAGGHVVLDLLVWWGGLELRVPADWRVVCEASVLLGGIADSRSSATGEAATTLVLRGLVAMGGVEIKN